MKTSQACVRLLDTLSFHYFYHSLIHLSPSTSSLFTSFGCATLLQVRLFIPFWPNQRPLFYFDFALSRLQTLSFDMSKSLSSLFLLVLALSTSGNASPLPLLGLGGSDDSGGGGGGGTSDDLLSGLLDNPVGGLITSTLGETLNLVSPATLICADVAGEFGGLAYALGCTCLGLSNQGILLQTAAVANVAGLETWVQDQVGCLSLITFIYIAEMS